MKNIGMISINVLGSNTQTPYMGDFEYKKHLTIEEMLNVERERDRNQGHSKTLSEMGMLMAECFAELNQRIIINDKTPQWFVDSEKGKKLKDFNVLFSMYLAIQDAMAKDTEALKKKVEEIKKENNA